MKRGVTCLAVAGVSTVALAIVLGAATAQAASPACHRPGV